MCNILYLWIFFWYAFLQMLGNQQAACVSTFWYIYIWKNDTETRPDPNERQSNPILIERNTPPWEVFLFTMFPNQEPGKRGPPLKNHPQNWSILEEVLQGGSSSFQFLIREHNELGNLPGGWGVLSFGGFFRSIHMSPFNSSFFFVVTSKRDNLIPKRDDLILFIWAHSIGMGTSRRPSVDK